MLKKIRNIPAGLALLVLGLSASGAGAQTASPSPGDACLAVSNGGGVVRLIWHAPRSFWPAGGWQILDESGKVLKRVRAGEAAALAGLPANKAAFVNSFAKGLPAFKDAKERDSFYFSLTIGIFTDPAFAQAAGFSASVDGLPAGRRTFRVVGVGQDGKPVGKPYPSPAVDASIPSLPPPPPEGLKAESTAKGVALAWTKAPAPASIAAQAFAVDRRIEGQKYDRVSAMPILISANTPAGTPVFLDESAPLEKKLDYRVFGVDAFGRLSAPAEAGVYHFDHAALLPPRDFKVSGGKGRNVLEWTPVANPRSGKLMIERAPTPAGPFAILTPDGVKPQAGRYEDAAVKGGLGYSYRIHIVGANGAAGPRSGIVTAAPMNAAAPKSPVGLEAKLERTRIRLTWKTAGDAVLAGYLVERKPKTGADWTRLNQDIANETRFDDYPGAEGPAMWLYRVRAVTLDNQESGPSSTVEVVVPDRSLPPVPEILSAEGSSGKAMVRFKPGTPEAKSASFVVLRSPDPRDIGVVFGRPLPASAREYVDPFVEPGQEYWYRMVAIDKAGNRSEPSEAISVRIGPPAIPAPPAPKAVFSAKPFPVVVLTFAPAPAGLEAVVQRKSANEGEWTVLSTVARGGEALDANPPAAPRIEYRIVYRTAGGAYGRPSPPAVVQR